MLIKKFENIDIKIIEDKKFDFLLSNEETAKGYDVRETTIRDHKSKHFDELIENKHFIVVTKSNEKEFNIKLSSKTRTKTFWTKRGIIRLGFFIKSERAKKFRDWAEDLVLEKIENTQNSKRKEEVEVNLLALNHAIEILRPSQASKIKMTEKLYQRLDLESCYLPKYTEEKLTRSLTYLLKKYEIKISTQKANIKLLEVGILEKMERDSSCGKTKYFYSLTEKGLEFGKNLISPKNERETQPHFFEDKFLELMKLF